MFNLFKNTFYKRAVLVTTTALFVFLESSAANRFVIKKSLAQIDKDKNAYLNNVSAQESTTIKRFAIKGGSVINNKILNLLDQYRETKFSSRLKQELIAKITKLYNLEGYILSYVNDVECHNSTLIIEVFEGSFRNITISDPKLIQNKLLQQYVNTIKAAPHPFRNTPKMERTFALIKKLPGLNEYEQTLEFKPLNPKDVDKSLPLTTDLIIKGEYHEFEGMAVINNRHKTNYVKQMQNTQQRNIEFNGNGMNGDFILDYNNPLNKGDKASLNVSYAGKGDVTSVVGSYLYPLNNIGTTINLTPFISHSSTYNGTIGTGGLFTLAHPLYLTRAKSLETSFSIETYHEDFKDFGNTQNIKTDITKVGLSNKFTHKLNSKIKYYITPEVQKSLHSVSNNIDSLKNRNFTKLLLSAGAEAPVSNLILSLDTQAQFSSKKTPIVEQLQIGQDKGGRGFRSGEIKGNEAAMASLELAHSAPFYHHFFLGRRLYGFIDGGYAHNTLLKIESRVVSTGVGADIFLRDNLALTIELAKPLLGDTKFSQPKKNKADKGIKIFGEIGYFFNF